MKLDKTNCIAQTDDYVNVGTCRIEGPVGYENISKAEKARVFEIPKVWRENGKQYKVVYAHINDYKDNSSEWSKTVVKAPIGCEVSTLYQVEYYD
jgi:hypothetical protein